MPPALGDEASARAGTAPRRVTRDRTQLFFDRELPPVVTVAPGERIVVETADSLCGLVRSERDVFAHIDEVFERLGGACPVTGPIEVSGAMAGQCVAVSIEAIDPAPVSRSGWTAVIPGWGSLVHDQGYTLQPPVEPVTTICEVTPEEVVLPVDGGRIRIPARPFLGTVGVAPRAERRHSLSQSREYLGDVDVPDLGVGTTLILPANVDGAMVSMGDCHAVQGDAEITGVAVEVEADVTVSFRVLDREEAGFVRLPIVESERWIGCIAGFQGVGLADCIRAGFVDLVRRLQRQFGFTERAAHQLLGQVGRVRVGNMIDPFYSALVSVDRRYLEG
jgi:acetamidase/formamidase